MIRFLAWLPSRPRNLPAQIRYLGPPHTTRMMNAIGDMMDRTHDIEAPGERNRALKIAAEALTLAASLEDK